MGKDLREELFRGTIVSDGLLVSRSDHDIEIASGVKVVFVPKDLSWILYLSAWVPFSWHLHDESISTVCSEVCVLLWLPKHICCKSQEKRKYTPQFVNKILESFKCFMIGLIVF